MSYYENRIKALEERVAKMALEQRMKAIPVEAKLVERIAEYQAENTRLKAEVERLNAVIESHKDAGIRIFAMMDEERRLTKHLKAEVERLRKAGDEMAEAMWYGDAERSIWVKKFAETEWNAAKEGKQP